MLIFIGNTKVLVSKFNRNILKDSIGRLFSKFEKIIVAQSDDIYWIYGYKVTNPKIAPLILSEDNEVLGRKVNMVLRFKKIIETQKANRPTFVTHAFLMVLKYHKLFTNK